MNKKLKIAIIAVAALLILNACLCFVSYIKFKTPNYIRSATGAIHIISGGDFAEISENPKIVLTKPGNIKIDEYLTNNGYEIIKEEQMGRMYSLRKDGEKQHALISVNSYYSKIIWQ